MSLGSEDAVENWVTINMGVYIFLKYNAHEINGVCLDAVTS
jgi:hypothetical protein